MNRDTLLFDALQTYWMKFVFFLVLTVFSLPALTGEPRNTALNGDAPGGSRLEPEQLFSLKVADAEAATLSTDKGHIWVYGKQRLRAYHSDGSPLIDQHYPDLPTTSAVVDLGVGYDSVWLAMGRSLYRFDEKGHLLKRRAFHTDIKAIHFDIKKSQILVITPKYVFVLDSTGHQLKKIRTHLPNIA